MASLRLRAEAIVRLYGSPFGPADVCHLAADILASPDEVDVGVLWNVPGQLPLADLPAVLDAVNAPRRDDGAERRNVWEVGSFFDRALVRVLETPNVIDGARLLSWLRTRQAFDRSRAGTGRDELRAALGARPERLEAILRAFLATFVPGDYRWYELSRFREAVFFEISPDQLVEGLLAAMAGEPAGSARELFFYEAALALSYQATDSQGAFERVYAVADNREDLSIIRARSLASELPDGRLENRMRRAAEQADQPDDPDRLRRDFARDAAAIASGAHLNGLMWAAKVYLAIFNDVDRTVAPEARFAPMLGDALAPMALDGLVAALDRTDRPTLQEVVDLALQRQHMNTWHIYLAGVSERFRRTSTLDGIPDELLRAMLAFDLTNPVPERDEGTITWIQHPWKLLLQHERPHDGEHL